MLKPYFAYTNTISYIDIWLRQLGMVLITELSLSFHSTYWWGKTSIKTDAAYNSTHLRKNAGYVIYIADEMTIMC